MAEPAAEPGLDRLFAHGWPGNVRELRNVVDRALALSPGARRFEELRIALEGAPLGGEALTVRSDLPYAEAKRVLLEAFEARYLADLLDRHDGNLSAAAREAAMDRKHLRELARRHGLLPEGS